eukprot:2793352-Alexandrium_andersonii.AAC.1
MRSLEHGMQWNTVRRHVLYPMRACGRRPVNYEGVCKGKGKANTAKCMSLSLIHISEPTRLALI